MNSVTQLKHELNDLSAAMANAKAAAANLETRLGVVIDAEDAERLAIALQAQRVVAANLANRIEAQQAAIDAAIKSDAQARYEALKAEQRAAAADALGATETALAAMADAFALNETVATVYLQAKGHPWMGGNDWLESRGKLQDAATVLQRLAG